MISLQIKNKLAHTFVDFLPENKSLRKIYCVTFVTLCLFAFAIFIFLYNKLFGIAARLAFDGLGLTPFWRVGIDDFWIGVIAGVSFAYIWKCINGMLMIILMGLNLTEKV